MDFDDINQSTVTSMADLIPQSDGQDNEKDFDDKFSLNNIQVKIEPTDLSAEKEMARQLSSTSTTSKVSTVTQKPIYIREWKMIVFISVLFVVMVTSVALIYHFYKLEMYSLDLGRHIHFDEISRKLDVYNDSKGQILVGQLGMTLPAGALPYNCFPEDNDIKNWDANRTCVGWKDKAQLKIEYKATPSHMNCYQFSWQSLDEKYYPYDCFSLGDGFWYGGILANTAPFQEQVIERKPFFTSTRNGDSKLGSVVEPFWLTSKNLALIVEGNPPLHFSVNSQNDGNLCLISQYQNSPYHNYNASLPQLNYTICSGPNILDVQKYTLDTYFSASGRNGPDQKVFEKPIYSTWANFKDDIGEDIILNYVQSLNRNNYVKGTVVLQEGWQIKHGDIKFDPNAFPNASAMVQTIQSLGFDVGVTVTHMVATDSDKFQQGIQEKFLVMDAGNAAPGLVQYWKGIHTDKYYGGYTAALDFFRDIVHVKRNMIFKSMNENFYIGYISFEGGQSDVLPYHSTFSDRLASPNSYSQMYAEFAAKSVPWAPIQSVYKCQHCMSFVQMYDFNSTDNRTENGLKAVLPSAISLGLMGYPFIIPGAIGGANYSSPSKLSKSLYIRWMQLVTFFPVMHFSIPPERYDPETVNIAKTLMDVHKNFVVPEIMQVFDDANEKLYPILRPMWWYNPDDSKCVNTHDQFMVGNKIMVAPILDGDSQKRDIYIPNGKWLDKNTDKVEQGPNYLYDYVAVDIVPYFQLQN